ncbi:hypothetical protein CL635_02460, partial [bacterium]|nr:hypothetical protein [bacterium]
MIKLLILIGLLLPTAYAQEEDTLYKKMKRAIELESHVEEASLPLQRFAIGVFHDTELDTADIADNVIPFEIRKEDYVDYSLRIDMITMCGDADLNTEYFTCLLAQTNLRQTIQRNFWLRRLGRELQAITSGYEMGIDGYPAKPIDVISRFSSITHLWRAANDPFVAPIVEVLTRARPWPRGSEDSIKEDAEAVVDRLKDMVRTWTAEEEDAEEKEDRDDMIG